jgi:hypothetical protein
VLIYFSGHGQWIQPPGGAKIGFLIPSDAEVDMSDEINNAPYLDNCIQMKEVWDTFNAGIVKHALVVVDACFSGFTGDKGGKRVPPPLAKVIGMTALEAITSGADHVSIEDDAYQHGVFTYRLLDLLRKRADGKPFMACELYPDTKSKVMEDTNGAQIPQMFNNNTSGEVVLFPSKETYDNVHVPAEAKPLLGSWYPLGADGNLNRAMTIQLRDDGSFTYSSPDAESTGTWTVKASKLELTYLKIVKSLKYNIVQPVAAGSDVRLYTISPDLESFDCDHWTFRRSVFLPSAGSG